MRIVKLNSSDNTLLAVHILDDAVPCVTQRCGFKKLSAELNVVNQCDLVKTNYFLAVDP